MCIDACPVGALTSGTYRYKTRPWEMNHVATICTHCGDGCKTTLGVRSTSDGSEIVRGDNRDKSGINGDFLCNKGRYAFDFANHTDRITQPLVRQPNGELKPVTWEQAFDHAGKKLRELRDTRGGKSIGVIGSNRTTNEEAYLLQKFARTVLGTNNIDHHRTADYVTFAQRPRRHKATAPLPCATRQTAPAILLLGGDPTKQAPGTAWNLRTNVRLNRARLYVVNTRRDQAPPPGQSLPARRPVRLRRARQLPRRRRRRSPAAQPPTPTRSAPSATPSKPRRTCSSSSAPSCAAQTSRTLIDFGLTIPGAKFALLADYANSRGAADMGLLPDMLPGYTPVTAARRLRRDTTLPPTPGLDMLEMFDAAERGELSALYVVGSNPVARYSVDPAALKNTFVVVQEMFLTETAALADVVLPAANLYEKSGSVTNSYGDLQQVNKAGDRAGVRTDFEMIVRIADRMGADVRRARSLRQRPPRRHGPDPRRAVRRGRPPRRLAHRATTSSPSSAPSIPTPSSTRSSASSPATTSCCACSCSPATTSTSQPAAQRRSSRSTNRRDLVLPANDTLFTSGTLGRYSAMLNDVPAIKPVVPRDRLTQIQTAAD